MAEAEKKIRYAMVVDLRKCVGCNACTVSCKIENQVPEGNYRTWVKEIEKGTYPEVTRYRLPRLCNHCDNAPCLAACPVKATYRADDGTILIDYDHCIGCKYCMAACPYDARFVNPVRKTAEKCTFCYHRVQAGLLPACVTTCVGGARVFGDLNDAESLVAKLVANNPVQVLKPEMNTEPMVYYIGAERDIMGARYTNLEKGEN
ncbi:sulfate reduction electron transfer complex DsrMKJOP subunit DsrO [Desulfitobacterium metallireducens]|uniref:4Fe-4S ferredoxin n=1 Tax=Desulfitobacterium metallireducens DSM 15288 TaxID=871968 RepID=W0EA61_9FIRM|nr:4Fe-4S ferredoxin [Desulfitobacterium metallireducens DSM 15288]